MGILIEHPRGQNRDFMLANWAPLVLIAGPCVIESGEHALFMARSIARIAKVAGQPFIFKASYDKANRTSHESFRGPGLQDGLKILHRIRNEVGCPIITDVHEPDHCGPVAEVADILQVPAFLSRQTDLVQAAARTGKPVLVKKHQAMHPADMIHVKAKAEAAGGGGVILADRGTAHGYRDLVTDPRAIPIMKRTGAPVVFDATHSVQTMGGEGGVSGGASEYIETVARAAVAQKIAGLFVEVHDDPKRALSDGPNALRLDHLPGFLTRMIDLDVWARRWEP